MTVRAAPAVSISPNTTGGAPDISSGRVFTPRFSRMAENTAALRRMLGWSLARFGIASRPINSARMACSCAVRH
jgi:hypothetical protein